MSRVSAERILNSLRNRGVSIPIIEEPLNRGRRVYGLIEPACTPSWKARNGRVGPRNSGSTSSLLLASGAFHSSTHSL